MAKLTAEEIKEIELQTCKLEALDVKAQIEAEKYMDISIEKPEKVKPVAICWRQGKVWRIIQ